MKTGIRGTCAVEGASSVFLCGREDGSLHLPGVDTYCIQHASGALQLGGTAEKRPENCGYGLPTMPGVRGPGGRGLQTLDDRREAELPIEATVMGTISVVREGFSGGYLAVHLQTQHGVSRGRAGQKDKEGGGVDNPRTFWVTFPAKSGPRPCLVEGCSGREEMQIAMRIHFLHRHVQDTVVIVEEFSLPHPRFPLCDMMVPWRSLNGIYQCTAKCKKVAGQN